MFIKNLEISNFRCFENGFPPIEFKVPDGSEGSGLNIFAGENGTGKTSVLEAIEYLTQSRLKSKSSISVKDFKDIRKKILVKATTETFEVDKVYGKDKKFMCKGIQFEAKVRENGADELVDTVVFDNKVTTSEKGIQPYELRTDVTKPWGVSRLPSFDIIFFEKNRNRHITHGMFPSKFDELTDDFNFQVIEKIKTLDDSVESEKELRQKIIGLNDYSKKVLLESLTDKFLGKVLKNCETFFDSKIRLEILDSLQPFTHSFFASRSEDGYQQIPVAKLGSGVEMIFSIIFLYHYYFTRGRKTAFLIDEPELHLHPTWQYKLIELLKEISKDTQVFISTHSPFIYKNCLENNLGISVFRKDKKSKISVDNVKRDDWGNFPWSPSWGEINYYAYNLPTIELHNELYGYLQEKSGINDIAGFDNYLRNNGVKDFVNYNNKATGKVENVTLNTYVRHLIHHPENKNNADLKDSELKKSIELLLGIFNPLVD